ncbi:MAG TPA: glycosyltransferase, partial [Candidatus Binatia bacterium]|nr:glycosyltransferase [Candidatus Binatia bacterium]
LVSVALAIWQFVVAMRFPLHRRIPDPGFAPDISILKPLKGADSETRSCLKSWVTQEYRGRVQILFGVHSPADPVCAVVRELILTHPNVDAELVVCPKMPGPNAKVSTLIQLQRLAKYEVVAISDADIRVPEDFLQQVVAPLAKQDVGLVNSFYRLVHPRNLAMRCEAFMVNGDFWSQVLQARSLGRLDFALGAAMITTQAKLREIGAFDSLVEYLADDYQLGNRIAKTGAEIVISPVVVESLSAPMTAKEVWQHQLRWARTIRVCQPAAYFFSILNNLTFWSLCWFLSNPPMMAVNVPFFGACLIVRIITGSTIEDKMTKSYDWSTFAMAIFSDLVRPIVWALSFLGNTVVWRGQKFRVLRGGKLVPCS